MQNINIKLCYNSFMKMSVSQVLNKGKKKEIYIRFDDGNRFAEGVFPDCKILKNEGFNREEIDSLKLYMSQNADIIEEMARSISLWKAFSK